MPRIAKPPPSVADPGKVHLCGAAPAVPPDDAAAIKDEDAAPSPRRRRAALDAALEAACIAHGPGAVTVQTWRICSAEWRAGRMTQMRRAIAAYKAAGGKL